MAFDSACRSLGTNRAGFVVSVLFIPLVFLFIRSIRRRWCKLKREWIGDIADAVVTALFLAVAFIGWHLVWVVPKDIYRQALSTRVTAPPPPQAALLAFENNQKINLKQEAINLAAELSDLFYAVQHRSLVGVDRSGNTPLTEDQTIRVFKLYRDGVLTYRHLYLAHVIRLLYRITETTGIDTTTLQEYAESIRDMALAAVNELAQRLVLLAEAIH